MPEDIINPPPIRDIIKSEEFQGFDLEKKNEVFDRWRNDKRLHGISVGALKTEEDLAAVDKFVDNQKELFSMIDAIEPKPSFIGDRSRAVERGFLSFSSADFVQGAKSRATEIDLLKKEQEAILAGKGTKTIGFEEIPGDAKTVPLTFEEGQDRLDEIQQRIGKAQNEGVANAALAIDEKGKAAAIPQSKGMREFMEAEGREETIQAVKDNFAVIAMDAMLESSVSMAAPISAGMIAGPVGAFAGGASVEYIHSFQEFVEEGAREKGFDPSDPEQLFTALQDQNLIDEAGTRAAVRGGIIGTVDAFTAGFGSLISKKLAGRAIAQPAGRAAFNLVGDPAGGSAGEALAQVAAGQELDGKDIFLEGFAQMGTGVGGTIKDTGIPTVQGIINKFGGENQKASTPTSADGTVQLKPRNVQPVEKPEAPIPVNPEPTPNIDNPQTSDEWILAFAQGKYESAGEWGAAVPGEVAAELMPILGGSIDQVEAQITQIVASGNIEGNKQLAGLESHLARLNEMVSGLEQGEVPAAASDPEPTTLEVAPIEQPATPIENEEEFSPPAPRQTTEPQEGPRFGVSENLFLPDGREIPIQYEVVEDGETFQAPDNDRDYSSPEERAKNEKRIQQFKPDIVINSNPTADTGPSIVDLEGEIQGGNRRDIILTDDRSYPAYREFLEQNAEKYGIDPEEIRGMKKPKLIRRLLTEKTDLNRALNDSAVGDIAIIDNAISAARLSDEEVQNEAARLFDEAEGIAPLAALQRGGAKALSRLMLKKGVIRPNDKSKYLNKTGFTDEGARLARYVLLSSVIQDKTVLQEIGGTPTETKMIAALPAIAKMKARGVDVSAISEAARMEVGRLSTKGKKKPTVDDYQAQQGLSLDDENAPTEAGKKMQKIIGENSSRQMKKIFNALAATVAPLAPGEASLTGEENRESVGDISKSDLESIIKGQAGETLLSNDSRVETTRSDEGAKKTDPRTGIPTFITGKVVTERQRQDGASENRRRNRQIKQVFESTETGGQVEARDEETLVESAARRLGVPIFRIAEISLNEKKEFVSEDFVTLKPGAEASPFLDEENGVVYKLFRLDANGDMGKKLVSKKGPDGWDVGAAPSDIGESLEKLAVLHEAGALATEIIGITPEGHVAVKQPQASVIEGINETHKAKASVVVNAIKVDTPQISNGHNLRVLWNGGKAWLMDDLHDGNVFNDSDGNPSIIDALLGEVSERMIEDIPELKQAILDARIKVGDLPNNQNNLNLFDDGKDILDDLPKSTGSPGQSSSQSHTAILNIEDTKSGLPEIDTPKAANLTAVVQLAKMLGIDPTVNKKLRRALGRAIGERDSNGVLQPKALELQEGLLMDADLALNVAAHELGHLFDYVPPREDGGTLVNKLAPLSKRGWENMIPALKDRVDEKMIARVEFFHNERKAAAIARVMAQKQFQDGKNQDKLRRKINEIELKAQRDITSKVGIERRKRGKAVISNELIGISKKWRGDFEVGDTYRNSSNELYADFISALLNAPVWTRENAPNAYRMFFDNLQDKPKVKEAYQQVQDLLSSNGLAKFVIDKLEKNNKDSIEAVIALARPQKISAKEYAKRGAAEARQNYLNMWSPITATEGSILKGVASDSYTAQLEANQGYAAKTRALFNDSMKVNVGDPLLAAGVEDSDFANILTFNRIINDTTATINNIKTDPSTYRAVMMWMAGELGASQKVIDGISKSDDTNLFKAGAAMVRELTKDKGMTTADVARLEAKATSDGIVLPEGFTEKGMSVLEGFNIRGFMLNTEGVTVETAEEGLLVLRGRMGEAKWKAAQEAAKNMFNLSSKIAETAISLGLYSDRVANEVIRPNMGNYIPFQIIEHFSGDVSASIKQASGSTKALNDSLTAFSLHNQALMGWIQRQQTALILESWAKEYDMGMKDLGAINNRKRSLGNDKQDVILIWRDGKPHELSFDEPGVAKAANNFEELNFLFALSKTTGGWFGSLFTHYSAGFIAYTNAIRDPFTQGQALGFRNTAKSYKQSARIARDYARSVTSDAAMTPEIRALVNEGILPPPSIHAMSMTETEMRDALNVGLSARDAVKGRVKATDASRISRALSKIDRGFIYAGAFGESLAKISASTTLERKGFSESDRIKTAKLFGIPNQGLGGLKVKHMGAISLFYGVTIQGHRALRDLMTDPKTRGGYALRMGMTTILPKVLMWAAQAGILGYILKDFGAGDDLEMFFKSISSYKKEMGYVIPLHWLLPDGSIEPVWGHSKDEIGEDWEAIGLRIPESEGGRVFGAMTWNALAETNDNTRSTSFLRTWSRFLTNQAPGLSPAIDLVDKNIRMSMDINPIDTFRNRPIIDYNSWNAGGFTAFAAAIKWNVEQISGGNIKFDTAVDTAGLSNLQKNLRKVPILNKVLTFDNFAGARERALERADKAKISARAKKSLDDKATKLINLGSRLQSIGADNRTARQQAKYELWLDFNRESWGGKRGLRELLKQSVASGNKKERGEIVEELELRADEYLKYINSIK